MSPSSARSAPRFRSLVLGLASCVTVLTFGCTLRADGEASAPAAAPAPAQVASPAIQAPAPARAGAKPPIRPVSVNAVILTNGQRLDTADPPVRAMGRVLYRTADGVQHALGEGLVDLEKTFGPGGAAAPTPAPATGAAPPQKAAAKPDTSGRAMAPDFEARTHDGKAVKLSDLRGKVVLVDFWATWCGPCIQEMPHVKKVHEKLASQGFEIVGVSLDHQKERLDKYLATQKITWPQQFDGKGWGNAVARTYGVSSIPATVLVDKQGRIAQVALRGPALEPAVARLLAEGS